MATGSQAASLLTPVLKPFKKVWRVVRRNSAKPWHLKQVQRQAQKHGKVSTLPSKTHKSSKPKSRVVRIVTWPWRNRLVRYGLLLFGLLMIFGLVYVMRDLPSPSRLTSKENFAVSTQIFDRNGKLLYEIFGDENRTPIDIDELPPYVAQATIAIEDKNFYKHFGFDVTGITRAILNNLQGQSIVGGSTITQQLVKTALLTNEKTWQRKAKEGVLAVLTEVLYSKKDILEMYLNYIPYGGTAVGIEAASQQYFDKPAKDLTLAEASLLVGLPQAPSRYSPFASDASAAKARQAEVLRRMVEDGYITALEAEQARAEPLKYALSKTDIQAPHFVFFVRDLLYQEYGEEMVERGGLRVTTTLDLDLQEAAQASVAAEIDSLERYRVGNGAAMVVKPDTGEILAMVGSRDYFDTEYDGQVNVTLASRQPGSSIKPIMYAIAMAEKLISPGTMLLDVPTCFEVPGQKSYCPKNYDGSYRGPVTIRQALGNSLNIPAVKGLKILGLETFIDKATDMGITSWKDPSRYGLSLTLGGGEVRMIDLAQAFSVIADEGVKVPLTPILRIEDFQGNVLETTDVEKRKADLALMNEDESETKLGDLTRVMPRAPAYLTAHIMQDNRAREGAFGSRSELVIPNQIVSAKTGTTNDLRDNWTVGFTPEFLAITWVGNNDNSPMNPALVSGVTGAAPIWNDIMSFILQGRDPVWQSKPPDVESAPVCLSGMPPQPGEACQLGAPELYWVLGIPSRSSTITENTWIRPETGLPPNPGEQAEGLVLESHTFYQDPLTQRYCNDCNRPVSPEGKIQYEQQVVTDVISTEVFNAESNEEFNFSSP